MDHLNEAYVNRGSKRIIAVSYEVEEESEEVYVENLHGTETVCYATAPADKPLRDAMSAQTLGRSLVTAARQKELKYFLPEICR